MLTSLRLRLLAAGSIAILAALILAGFGLGLLFQHHIEQREVDALTRDATLLVGGLRLDPAGLPLVDTLPSDDRYAQAGSGLYWQVSTARGSTRSDSLWDQRLPGGTPAHRTAWQSRHVPGPFGNTLLIVERVVRLTPGGAPILVQVATNDESLLEERREFNTETAASLVILWLFLVVAAYVQVTLGLRPLADIRRRIGLLRSDPAARMAIAPAREIAPLTEAINALADTRQADLERARRRAGDLAHSLKTPLAALAAQSRRARQTGSIDAADGLDRAIASIRAALEAELARSRAATFREGAESRAAAVETLIDDLISVVERTESGEKRFFDVAIPGDLRLPIASDDLTEVLGALIENAAKYARFHVRISGAATRQANSVAVEDDGPGIGDERLEAALVRGGRLDEAGHGHGFGLAIVHDLVSATGGNLTLGKSALGGLAVRIEWPVHAPAPAPRRRWLTRH